MLTVVGIVKVWGITDGPVVRRVIQSTTVSVEAERCGCCHSMLTSAIASMNTLCLVVVGRKVIDKA